MRRRSPRIQRRQFPGERLAGDALSSVLAFLPWHDLGSCQLVNKSWRDSLNAGATATQLWTTATSAFWSTKVYVPKDCLSLLHNDPKTALRRSLADAKRQCITLEELASFEWNFRFKRLAGEAWTNHDPWWEGRSPRRIRFRIDEERWGGDRGHAIEGELEWVAGADEWSSMPWRFTQRIGQRGHHPVMTWQAAELGSDAVPAWPLLQVREYPEELILRTKNWGWIMHSTWVLYTSFPMPLKDEDAGELGDRRLRTRLEPWQWQAAEDYNNEAQEDESTEEDSDQGQDEGAGGGQ